MYVSVTRGMCGDVMPQLECCEDIGIRNVTCVYKVQAQVLGTGISCKRTEEGMMHTRIYY